MKAFGNTESSRLIGARIDRLPMTRHIWLMLFMLALGAFFEAYDLSLTGLVAPGLVKDGIFAAKEGLFGLPDQASFSAATFLGLFVGALLFGRFADRLGRKKTFTHALLIYTAATVVMAFQHQAICIDFCRFIAGIGLGVELVTIDAYIAEIAPARYRGRAFAFAAFIQFLAIPISTGLSLALIPYSPLGFDGWRWVCVIGCVGASVVWIARTRLPESPRWLAQRGFVESADRIVSALEAKCFAPGEIPAALEEVPLHPVGGNVEHTRLFAAPWGRRIVMLTVLNVFITTCFYGFQNWVPTLLAAQGHTIVKSFQYTLYIALVYPLCPLAFMLFADRIERKWQLAFAAVAGGILGICFAHQSSSIFLVLFGISLTICNVLSAYAIHAYQSELFPSAIRAEAIGFAYSWGRLAAVFSSLIIGLLLQVSGPKAVFFFLATSQIIVAVTVTIMGPRTIAGRSFRKIGASEFDEQPLHGGSSETLNLRTSQISK